MTVALLLSFCFGANAEEQKQYSIDEHKKHLDSIMNDNGFTLTFFEKIREAEEKGENDIRRAIVDFCAGVKDKWGTDSSDIIKRKLFNRLNRAWPRGEPFLANEVLKEMKNELIENKLEKINVESLSVELGDQVPPLTLISIQAGSFMMGSPTSANPPPLPRNRPPSPSSMSSASATGRTAPSSAKIATKTTAAPWEISFRYEAGRGYEIGRDDLETQHQVRITKPFFMGVYPVTQAQYEAVMGNNPSIFKNKPDSPQRPVENVSRDDANEFCKRLSQKTGRKIRLPTEAEWEYACRAGTTTRFNTGDDLSTYDAQFSIGETIVVGTFRPNAWGLYDMHGNVLEWCSDWFGRYPGKTVADPKGPPQGTHVVLRGGAHNAKRPWGCRSAARSYANPYKRSSDLMDLQSDGSDSDESGEKDEKKDTISQSAEQGRLREMGSTFGFRVVIERE